MRSRVLFFAFALLGMPGFAQPNPGQLRLLTTEPEADMEPSLAADAKDVWMAFVSERGGNSDIYAIRLSEALREAPRLIAPDPASDRGPSLSPDAKWLAWVSDREDALGDIWVMKFPQGAPRQISKRGERDRNPRWSADTSGSLVLLYDVESADGATQTVALKAGNWPKTNVPDSGSAPELPLEILTSGSGLAGTSATGAPVYIVPAYSDDTDGDGRLGTGDDPSVWMYEAGTRAWHELTPPLPGLNAPQMVMGRLVFSSKPGNNLEVVEVVRPFDVAGAGQGGEALEAARRMLRERPLEPFNAIAMARQGYLNDSSTEAGQRALLFAVDALREAQRPEEAMQLLDAAARRSPLAASLENEAEARRQLLRVEISERALTGDTDWKAMAASARKSLAMLRGAAGATGRFKAWAGLEVARLSEKLGENEQAVAAAQSVEDAADAPDDMKAEAMLRRARVYRQLVPSQAQVLLVDLIKRFPEQAETVDAAALEFADCVEAGAEGRDAKVLALRQAASGVSDLTAIQAASRLAEGELFARSGNPAEAAQSYQVVLKFQDEQPLLGARASFALAELLSQQAKYAEAIQTYEAVAENLRDRFFRGAPEFIVQARQSLIRQLQTKGNYELRVNDPQLARATFDELIRREPELAEGWRGFLEAEFRTGLLTPDEIEKYHTRADAKPDSAIEQYKYGLALTYRDPMPEKSADWLRRSIVRDGTVPYFHQTLGFVHEHFGRINGDRGEQADALQEYQRALALMDAAERPEDYATLLINAGNAGLAMGNSARAVYFYQRWKDQSVKITDPRTEFLFYRSFGIALFRSGRPTEAAPAFASAIDLLKTLKDRKYLNDDRIKALETELLDRQALALLESGVLMKSADMFQKVADRQPPDSLNRVRALRNRGVALHRLSLRRTGIDREVARRLAEESLTQATELIRSPKLTVTPELPESGSQLFNLKLTMGTGDQGSAQQGFTREEEERLLSAALARVKLEGGQPSKGIDELRAYLNIEPKLNDGNRAYYVTARLVALDQLASELARDGRPEEAVQTLLDAVETARYDMGGAAQYNGGGLSRILTRLTELHLKYGGALPTSAQLRNSWLASEANAGDATEVLDAMVGRALLLRTGPETPYVINQPAARGRLMMSRLLLSERESCLDRSGGLAAMRSAAAARRAEILGRHIIDLAREAPTGGEIKRLAVLSYGALLRTASGSDDPEAVLALSDEATSYAKAHGYPGLVWWLKAQPILTQAEAMTPVALDAVLAELESVSPGEFDASFDAPYELLSLLGLNHLKAAITAGDWEGAWFVAERWRAVTLRMAFDSATPPEDFDDPKDEDWTRRFIEAREELRGRLDRWRNNAVASDSPNDLQDAARAKDALRALIEEGRSAELRSAQLFAPKASELADAEFLIAGGLAIPAGSSIVLHTPWGSVAWSAEGQTKLPDAAAMKSYAEKSPVWFVMGAPMESGEVPGVTLVNMLSFESTFSALYNVRFDTGEPFFDVAAALDAGPELEKLEKALAGEANLQLPPIRVDSSDPFASFLGDSPVQLGSLLPEIRDAVQVRAEVKSPETAPVQVARAGEASIAAALAHGTVASAELDGRRWIGSVFAPELLPDAAEAEVAGNTGLLTAFLGRGETQNALAPARKLFLVQKALKYPVADVAVTGTVLTQIEEKLGRLDAAVKTAKNVVELRRQEADPAELADALRRLGNVANDGRQFEIALAAYDEVLTLKPGPENLADWIDAEASAGAVLENWGRTREALDRFEKARDAARQIGDPVLESQEWSRIGRIELRWLNRYERADAAFKQAESLAGSGGAEELRLAARLDQARVQEKVGDYETAVTLAEEVRDAAKEAGYELMQSDAQLVVASVEWARADYFKAFRYQRRALDLVDKLGDAPMRIIALNRAGLIYWALNDSEKALEQFNQAIDLASRGLDLGEVASSYNNRGLVYRQEKQYDLALADFAKAFELDQKQENDWGLGYSTRNTGMTYLQMGDAERSLEPIQAAIDHSGKIGDVTNLAKAVLALGDAYRALGRTDDARLSYEDATTRAEKIPLPEVQWRAQFGLANLELTANNPEAAKKYLSRAIDIVEGLRARIKVEEFQDGFLQDKQELYDVMVQLLLDEGDSAGAFTFSERSRGRSFIDLLGNQKIALRSDRDAAEVEQERQLRTNISDLERQIGQAEDQTKRETLEKELEKAQRAFSDFLIDLRVKNPQLASFVEVPTQDLASLQDLIEPTTRLLVYHVLPEEVVAWVISKDSIQATRTPIDREELSGRLQGFRQRLQNFDEVNEELAILSRILLEPNLPLLGDAKQVCVIPHRELHRMPFAALQIGLENFVDRYALFYSPSASVLRYTYGKGGAVSSPRKAHPRVLALGNPDLGNTALSLPFAEKEAKRIAWTFPGAMVVTGDKANETWLRENSQNFDAIHLATHGEYDAALPLLSSILLTGDSKNDGRLTAQEIFSMTLNANFVALSACQSGLGKLSNGDDIIGLNRAFVYAGTRQLLSTLWRVDDVSTAVLVKHFYRNSAHESRAEALREAQIEVRSRYPHPAHWAGMFLSGDWK